MAELPPEPAGAAIPKKAAWERAGRGVKAQRPGASRKHRTRQQQRRVPKVDRTIRLPEDVDAALRDVCQKYDINPSAVIRRALLDCFAKYDPEIAAHYELMDPATGTPWDPFAQMLATFTPGPPKHRVLNAESITGVASAPQMDDDLAELAMASLNARNGPPARTSAAIGDLD